MTIPWGQRLAATLALLAAAALTPLVGSTAAHAADFPAGPNCSSQETGVAQAISDRDDARDNLVDHKTDVFDPAVAARDEAVGARRSARDARIDKNAAVAEARDAYDADPTEENAQLLAAAKEARALAVQNHVDARLTATDKIAALHTAFAERGTLHDIYTGTKSDLADARAALATCQTSPYASIDNLNETGDGSVYGDFVLGNLPPNEYFRLGSTALCPRAGTYPDGYYCSTIDDTDSDGRFVRYGALLGTCAQPFNDYYVWDYFSVVIRYQFRVDFSSVC